MFNFKEKIEDYTEKEFLELLGELINATSKDKSLKGQQLEKYLIALFNHFIRITEHPKKEISFATLKTQEMRSQKTL